MSICYEVYGFCGNILAKCPVVLDKEQCRLKDKNQFFNLNPAKYVDVVERFVPYIQMRLLTQTPRQQHFFLLPCAVIAYVFLKLNTGKIQLSQNRPE